MSHYVYNPQQYQQTMPTQWVNNANQIDFSSILLYQIKGKPAFAYADLQVQPNQRVITDANMLLWMDSQCEEPETVCWGSCCTACGRSLAGEHMCFNTFTNSSQQNRKVTVGYNDPGDLLALAVTKGNGWILTKNAFVAGTDNLDVSGKCIGLCACMLSGEGAFLTHVRMKEEADGGGITVVGSFGALVRHDIPQGQCLYVTKGLFFAAHEDTKFRMGLAGGLKNLCCSGGAIVMKFYGPAVVYTQSRDPAKWNPYKSLPKEKKKKNQGGLD